MAQASRYAKSGGGRGAIALLMLLLNCLEGGPLGQADLVFVKPEQVLDFQPKPD